MKTSSGDAGASSALIYPYFLRDVDASTELLARINDAVPRNLPETIRADVCQELALSILSGEAVISNAGECISQHIKKQFAFSPYRYGHVSFDREELRNQIELQMQRPITCLAEYFRNYKKHWAARNKDKCRTYGRAYRARNLATIRSKQRDSYRRVNNVAPEKYRPKVTAEIVLEMRGKYAKGASLGALALEYDLKEQTAYDALTGRTWKNLPLPDYASRRKPNRGRHIK